MSSSQISVRKQEGGVYIGNSRSCRSQKHKNMILQMHGSFLYLIFIQKA